MSVHATWMPLSPDPARYPEKEDGGAGAGMGMGTAQLVVAKHVQPECL